MEERDTVDDNEEKKSAKDINEPKRLAIGDNSEILISMSIDEKCIFQRLGITKDEAIGILKVIGYGKIGDEKYNIL